MTWRAPTVIVALLAAVAFLACAAQDTRAQSSECGTNHAPVQLGTPDAQGTTIEDKLSVVSEKKGYYFTVPSQRAAYVYVGDQWFDLDLFLYSRKTCKVFTAWSVNVERRTLQFVRPDEQIIELLEPGDYLLVVGHKYAELPGYAAEFNPNRGYTVRVALGPPTCAVAPPNEPVRLDEAFPGAGLPPIQVMRRPKMIGDKPVLYQLSIAFEPQNPGPFSLMSFNASISPPYSDLFDFSWEVDGKPVVGADPRTIQMPTSSLAKTPDGMHVAKVTARGARVYPDPDQPHVPLDGGSLVAECRFKVGTS